MQDEIIQYFIVNQELNMSPGKIAVQIGHGATLVTAYLFMKNKSLYWLWQTNHQKKIVLRAKQKVLENLSKLEFAFVIKDIGLTEIPVDSLTVITFLPMEKSKAQKYIKRLQLL